MPCTEHRRADVFAGRWKREWRGNDHEGVIFVCRFILSRLDGFLLVATYLITQRFSDPALKEWHYTRPLLERMGIARLYRDKPFRKAFQQEPLSNLSIRSVSINLLLPLSTEMRWLE